MDDWGHLRGAGIALDDYRPNCADVIGTPIACPAAVLMYPPHSNGDLRPLAAERTPPPAEPCS